MINHSKKLVFFFYRFLRKPKNRTETLSCCASLRIWDNNVTKQVTHSVNSSSLLIRTLSMEMQVFLHHQIALTHRTFALKNRFFRSSIRLWLIIRWDDNISVVLKLLDQLFVTGGKSLDDDNAKTELLSLDTFTWTVSTDFPFSKWDDYARAYEVPSLHFNSYFHVIGCFNRDSSACDPGLISRFNPANGEWQKVGNMVLNRNWHSAIIANGKLMIFGGDVYPHQSEICEINEDDYDQILSCSLQGRSYREDPTGGSYSSPELFLVDARQCLIFWLFKHWLNKEIKSQVL